MQALVPILSMGEVREVPKSRAAVIKDYKQSGTQLCGGSATVNAQIANCGLWLGLSERPSFVTIGGNMRKPNGDLL